MPLQNFFSEKSALWLIKTYIYEHYHVHMRIRYLSSFKLPATYVVCMQLHKGSIRQL